MNVLTLPGGKKSVLFLTLTCLLVVVSAASAKSPVKMVKLDGSVDLSGDGPYPFVLEGTASHLGNYDAYGEVEFLPGDVEGSLVGVGPVVFEAVNGDLLVGTATWTIDPEVEGVAEAHVHFGWQESVEFSDGTVVANTGRFVSNRPPGLIVVVSSRTLVDLLILILQSGGP